MIIILIELILLCFIVYININLNHFKHKRSKLLYFNRSINLGLHHHQLGKKWEPIKHNLVSTSIKRSFVQPTWHMVGSEKANTIVGKTEDRRASSFELLFSSPSSNQSTSSSYSCQRQFKHNPDTRYSCRRITLHILEEDNFLDSKKI